jgi:predicted short-subunit dehydrogenase-like oxidoreductase (DUF2520 family)
MNIIGCGRAAGSLARLWIEAGSVSIGGIVNRSIESGQQAVEAIGQGAAASTIAGLEPADYWLIGTTDQQIEPVAAQLAGLDVNLEGSLVFHLAGRFGLDVLDHLPSRGAQVAALHPVRSLTHAQLGVDDFAGTACVAEGPDSALELLKPLVTSIGGTWLPVASIDRGLYHAAVAVISNITKAVAWKAQKWQVRAGLPEETAMTVTHQLLNSTMTDLFRSGARQTITGPIVRGDTSTIEAHVEAVREAYPDDLEIYQVLISTVLDLAVDRGDLDEKTQARFDELLRIRS